MHGRKPRPLLLKAVPALAAGAALFFSLAGCQPKAPSDIRRPPEEPVAGTAYEQGLEHERRGEDQKAFEAYRRYVEAEPEAEEAPDALHRMARIKQREHRFEEALSILERISKDYPDYSRAVLAQYNIMEALFHLDRLKECREKADQWLQRNPGHDLEGQVLFLMGRAEEGLDDYTAAVRLYSRAARILSSAPHKLEELEHKAEDLIESASLEDLKSIRTEAEPGPFLPLVLLRTARLHLDADELLDAREAAKALIEAASDPDLILEGRKILARIDEDLISGKGRIGCLLPLTGPFAIYGKEALNGIQLAASDWKRPKSGLEIELLIRDTKGSDKTAAAAVEELAREQRVSVIIGPLAGRAAEAAAEKAQELGVPIIALSQREGIPETGEMVFRNFLTPSAQVDVLAETAVWDLGIRRFGVLFPENAYGNLFMGLFQDKVEELGAEITTVEFYPTDKTDFAGEVRRMVKLDRPFPGSAARGQGGSGSSSEDELEPIVEFEAVFIPDIAERAAMIIPQFPFHKVLGLRFLGTSLWQSEDLIETSGDYIQDAIFPSAFFEELDSLLVRDFTSRYRRIFEAAPGLLAATGYDTLSIIKHVLESRRVLTRKDIQEALVELEGVEGITGRLSFQSSGELDRRPLVLTVKGKRFEPFTPPFAATSKSPSGGLPD